MPPRFLASVIIAAMLASYATSANSASTRDKQVNTSFNQHTFRNNKKDYEACLDFVFDDDAGDYCADDEELQDLFTNKEKKSVSGSNYDGKKQIDHGANIVVDTGSTMLNIEFLQKSGNNVISNPDNISSNTNKFYVIVVHSRIQDGIYMPLVDATGACTGFHPNLGLTQPSQGSLHAFAHVAYFGPYATGKQALDRRNAVRKCVPTAYIGTGIIEGY